MDSKLFLSDAVNYFSKGYLFPEEPLASSEILIKELSECPASRALLEEAQEVIKELGLQALEIRLAPPKSKFKAETQGNIITINPALIASAQRDSAIFELTNVIHLKEHRNAWLNTANGVYKSSEEFVRAAEFIEYKGIIRAKAVAETINKEKGRFFRPYIESAWRYIPIEAMGFNLYYSLYLSSAHKEHHRNNWREINKTLNLSTQDNSSSQNANNPWLKRILTVSLIGCRALLTACTLSLFYRLVQMDGLSTLVVANSVFLAVTAASVFTSISQIFKNLADRPHGLII